MFSLFLEVGRVNFALLSMYSMFFSDWRFFSIYVLYSEDSSKVVLIGFVHFIT